MTTFTQDELTYLDIKWFMVDANGEIAILSTGGTGEFSNSSTLTKEVLEELYNHVSGLHPTTQAIPDDNLEILLVNHRYSVPEMDLEDARRGLYVFDAMTYLTHDPSQYIRVARPAVPLNIENLDENFARLLRLTRNEDVNLSISTRLHL